MSKHLKVPAHVSKYALGTTVFTKDGTVFTKDGTSGTCARQVLGIKSITQVSSAGDFPTEIKTEITYQLSGGRDYNGEYSEDRVFHDPYEALGISNPYVAVLSGDAPAFHTGDEVVVSDTEPPRNAMFLCYSPCEEGVALVQYQMPGTSYADGFDWVALEYVQLGRAPAFSESEYTKSKRKIKPNPADVAEAKAHIFQVNDKVQTKFTKHKGVVAAVDGNLVQVDLERSSAHSISGRATYKAKNLELIE